MRFLYKYPQAEFPYVRLAEENRRRGRNAPEFELLDSAAVQGLTGNSQVNDALKAPRIGSIILCSINDLWALQSAQGSRITIFAFFLNLIATARFIS
jgi:hypothetical protein